MALQVNSLKKFKKSLHLPLLNSSKTIGEEETIPRSFYEATHHPDNKTRQPDKDITKKKITGQYH